MSNHNRTARAGALIAFLGAISSGCVMSQPVDNTAEYITQSQRNTAKLKARIEEAKAQKELDDILTPKPVEGAKAPAAKPPIEERQVSTDERKPSVKPTESDHGDPAPSLLAIFGVGNSLYASLRMTNGITQDVRVGDTVEGGFSVKAISSSSVILLRGGKEFPLRVFAGPTTGFGGKPQAVGSPLPGSNNLPAIPGTPGVIGGAANYATPSMPGAPFPSMSPYPSAR